MSARPKSATFDEIAHLTGGYSYWLTGDFRLHPENGVLPQRWAALPLVFGEVRFPSLERQDWWHSDVFAVGGRFFYREGNDPDIMLVWGRGMVTVLALALGVVVYLWSRQLFGPVGACFSLVLFTFSPMMLAHGRLVTSDMATGLMFTVSVGLFWRAIHDARPATVIASGLAMGGLFCSKMSAVIILPVALVLLVVRVVRRSESENVRSTYSVVLHGVVVLLVHGVVAAAVIWASYGFRVDTFREYVPGRDRMDRGHTLESLTEDSGIGSIVRVANDVPVLPRPYLHGFAFAYRYSRQRASFLNGAYSDEGFSEFFPYTLWAKTPPATLFVLVLALSVMLFRARPIDLHYRTAPLWVFLVVYWLFAVTSHLNIGQRHLLPTYPAMFVLAGAASYWFTRSRLVAIGIGAAMLHLVVQSVGVHPHYLAYFSPFVGGPETGYRHLVDSSLDWGQDLGGLKRRLDRQRARPAGARRVYLSYFGTADPEHEGLEVTMLPSYPDRRSGGTIDYTAGTYCISATMLQGVYGPAPERWRPSDEASYRDVERAISELERKMTESPGLRELIAERNPVVAESVNLVDAYEHYRLARLSSFLRAREPDDHVGYSILIYELSEADVAAALTGPITRLSDRTDADDSDGN